MKVLIACECSGVVRDAMIRRGHDAMSCDLKPTEQPGPHYQGDVRDVLGDSWDLIVAHPECTYMANSGVQWLDRDITRWKQMWDACEFFRLFLHHSCPRVAIENPIMHKYAKRWIGKTHDQVIQPWQYGHGETKATCLWIKGLPRLTPTNIVSGRVARVHREPPGPQRKANRSRTYTGIAEAMAKQFTQEQPNEVYRTTST